MAEYYCGEIRMFAGLKPPENWVFCNGQSLNTADYQVLYSLIGYTYGGSGSTFKVPDLRGRAPISNGTLGANTYALGQTGGSEVVTLTEAQLPAHTHTMKATATAGTSATPANNYPAAVTTSPYTNTTTGLTSMNPATTSNEGGNQPHDNMMPSIAINFMIATVGIYPTPP